VPGWPTVDRAGDQELVEALRRADADAPATLFDSYGERLYDYAFALAGDRDQAADSVHDALVTAYGCVARLKEPGRLRAWLYALTRLQVRARMAHRSGTPAQGVPLPEIEEPADPELAGLVRETLGELGARFPGATLGAALEPPVKLPDGGADLYVQPDQYRETIAADLPAKTAALLAATQRPVAAAAFGEPAGLPAWRTVPSRFIYGSADKAIAPPLMAWMAQRAGSRHTIVVQGASHAVLASHPEQVARLIEEAAGAD